MTRYDKTLTVDLSDSAGTFSLYEICERGECHAEFVIKLVDYGVIAPVEESEEIRQWQFDMETLARLRKAMRLQRDLKINLPGLAMSLELLDEVQDMRREVDRLHRQLQQFMEKP